MTHVRNEHINHYKEWPSDNTSNNHKMEDKHKNQQQFENIISNFNTRSCARKSSSERRDAPQVNDFYWSNSDATQTRPDNKQRNNTFEHNIDVKSEILNDSTSYNSFENILSREEIIARRKQKVAARRQMKKIERQQLKQIVSGVQVAKPDFSLEQAAEDFPALCSIKKVKKTKCNKVEEVDTNLIPGDSQSRPVEKSWKPKIKDPIYFNLSQALQPKPEKPKNIVKKIELHNEKNKRVGNILDSDNPTLNKGKVRPNKVKKPSKLKEQILSERNERRERMACGKEDEQPVVDNNIPPLLTETSDQISDGLDKSELLQSDKIYSPVELENNQIPINVVQKIHSRKFREYCTNCISDNVVNSVCALLERVVYFQDRTFAKDPIKANAKRRYVAGLNQTNKYLQVKKIKLLIIAPDLERCPGTEGLDERIRLFKKEADHQGVPYVFGPNRKRLGKAVLKNALVSCVGILSYEGAEEQFTKVLETLQEAKTKYQDLVNSLSQKDDEDCENADICEEQKKTDVTSSLLSTLKEELLSPGEKLLNAINHTLT